MNYCILLFMLIATTSGFSQENKADSIRWIRLTKTKANQPFFQYHYSEKNSNTLIGCVRENALNASNVFFVEYPDISEKRKLYFALTKHLKNDSVLILSDRHYYTKNIDSIIQTNILFDFRKDFPYMDESGEAYEIDCFGYFQFTSGMLCFSYPPEIPVILDLSLISEIRIREERQLNESTKQPEYVPTAIQLYTGHRENMQNNIWMDLNRLRQNNPEINHTKWLNDLTNKSYSGEQYMQLKYH